MNKIGEIARNVTLEGLEAGTMNGSQQVTNVAINLFGSCIGMAFAGLAASWCCYRTFKPQRSEEEIREITDFLNEWKDATSINGEENSFENQWYNGRFITSGDNAFEIARIINEYLRCNSTELFLSTFNIIRLPSIVFRLKELTKLTVECKNKILPENLFNFPNLIKVDISCNIEHIPIGIRNLKSTLTHLNLRCCKIKHIPDWIGELANLEELDLGRDRIENLPESIGKLKKLKKLHLSSVSSFDDLEKVLLSLPPCCTVFIYDKDLSQFVLESILKTDPSTRAKFEIF